MPRLVLLLLLATFSSTLLLGRSVVVAASMDDPQLTDGLAPADSKRRPHYDLVVAAFVTGGDTKRARDEIARVRQIYARYDGRVVPASQTTDTGVYMAAPAPLTLKLVFVVGRAGLPGDVEVPKAGLLLGDFYHVNIREGHSFLAGKTRALMGISDHLSFRFLAKTDGDIFPCWGHISRLLVDVHVDRQPRLYAGHIPTGARVRRDGRRETSGANSVTNHPYPIGSLYILGERLVQLLNGIRDLLQLFPMEDAMVGNWLLGVDKVKLETGGSLHCSCMLKNQKRIAFARNCTTSKRVDICLENFGAC